MQPQDANWLVPLGIAVGGSIASDRWVPRTLNLSPKTTSRFDTLSTLGVGGMVAAGGGMYILGHIRHDDYQSRAGFLAGEAMVDSLAVGETLKFAFGRERPGTGSGRNKFFQGGNSFPSGHSILAWSAAGALTEAYPGWGSKMLFFGGATAISLSRILANKHAPSDVIVGSTLGYLIGRHVYRSHTVDQEIARQFGTFKKAPHDHYDEVGTPNRGSVYVPIDSWVYPVFDRLVAMGYVKSAFLGLRPWTRDECERLVDEIPPTDDINNPVAQSLVSELRAEFSERESPDFQGLDAGVDSLYVRTTGISGKPLTNDLDFGSTMVNDYGRPFQEGFNAISGGSAHAVIGPLAFYIRAEYQHAPEAPPLPLAARLAIQEATQNGIASLNPIPVPPDIPTAQLDRVHLLDAYVGWNFANWELSFGKQTLWWGPGAMGPMLISNNVDPITMARLNRAKPFTLPGIFKLLGPIRTEFFIGRLSGQNWIHVPPYTNVGAYTQSLSDQPYISGQKISLKPTPNLEIGVSRTSLFGGPGFPVTPRRLKNVFFSFSTSNGLTTDPGDRRTSFDFNYRIPGLRKWLILYADSFAEDEINPIAYPRRSAMNPGIFIPQLPKLRHMELRAEAAYTDLPGLLITDYFYWNLRYLSGYTSNGHIIGDWVGRQGKALQFSSAYWFTARNKVEVAYRKLSVNPDTGRRGTQQDLRATVDWQLSPTVQASGWVQHERWNFPVLAPTPVSNTAISFQLTYTPKWHLHR
ncbi:MAG: capsule assembly Wzi family protein [Terriglobia bacterium]|nr:capsule assembly Wzi family protein [Terriglobia bacterium]